MREKPRAVRVCVLVGQIFERHPFVVQAGGWTWYLSAPGWWPLGLIGVTSLTFLGGFVLLLIGRDYDSIIDETN